MAEVSFSGNNGYSNEQILMVIIRFVGISPSPFGSRQKTAVLLFVNYD